MVFGFKVVEEGSLTDIRCFGDVFDGDVGQSTLGNQRERAAKKPQPGFVCAALAAAQAQRIVLIWEGGRD
jgi:hypothetical protein